MIINGKTYTVPELDFNAMCELEDMGVVINEMDKKVMTTVRGFLALAMNSDMESAGRELEEYIASGGKMETIVEEMNRAVSESGFFQALSQKAKTENRTDKKAETEEAE